MLHTGISPRKRTNETSGGAYSFAIITVQNGRVQEILRFRAILILLLGRGASKLCLYWVTGLLRSLNQVPHQRSPWVLTFSARQARSLRPFSKLSSSRAAAAIRHNPMAESLLS